MVLHKLSETEKELDEYIEKYDINKCFSILYMFFANDLSSFFYDIRKDCLYCYHKDDQKSKAYRMVLYTLFQHIVKILALIMVFTAEEAVRKSNSKKDIKQYSIFSSPSLLDMKL